MKTKMILEISSIFLLSSVVSVSCRIVEQWPVLPNEKPEPEFIYNIEHVPVDDRDWERFYGFSQDIKPVKEVQTLIVTKKVPLAYATENYLTYSPEKNYPFPVAVEKEVPYPVKKIIPLPVESRVPFAVSKPPTPHPHRPVSYSIQYVKVPVPHPVPRAVHVEGKIPIPYPIEHSIPHSEVTYPFPVHINVPLEKPVAETKKPQTIFLEKSAPHFSIYLVPFPIEKAAHHNKQPHQTYAGGDNEHLEERSNSGYFTSLKPQDSRSPLYSVSHKLYNAVKEDKKPPQVVDFNHPIDHDEE